MFSERCAATRQYDIFLIVQYITSGGFKKKKKQLISLLNKISFFFKSHCSILAIVPWCYRVLKAKAFVLYFLLPPKGIFLNTFLLHSVLNYKAMTNGVNIKGRREFMLSLGLIIHVGISYSS